MAIYPYGKGLYGAWLYSPSSGIAVAPTPTGAFIDRRSRRYEQSDPSGVGPSFAPRPR